MSWGQSGPSLPLLTLPWDTKEFMMLSARSRAEEVIDVVHLPSFDCEERIFPQYYNVIYVAPFPLALHARTKVVEVTLSLAMVRDFVVYPCL